MIAADIMIHPVIAIAPQTTLAQAIRLLVEHRVSGLPVVGPAGEVVGMLTEGDLLRRTETGTAGEQPGWLTSFLLPGRQAGKYIRTHGRRVDEVMTTDVVAITEDTPLADVVGLMRHHHIKRLPVLRDGRLLGIVSRADVVRQVGAAMPKAAETADDSTIRNAIIAAMEQQPWAPGKAVSVAVQNGVVQLDGCLFDLRQRDALGVLAENVAGVTRVDNQIVCVEPNTGMVTYDPTA